MTTLEKYNECFIESFQTQETTGLKYKVTPLWDSVGHITLVAAIEDAFDISLEPEDMMSLLSYEEGIEILKKYGVEFE